MSNIIKSVLHNSRGRTTNGYAHRCTEMTMLFVCDCHFQRGWWIWFLIEWGRLRGPLMTVDCVDFGRAIDDNVGNRRWVVNCIGSARRPTMVSPCLSKAIVGLYKWTWKWVFINYRYYWSINTLESMPWKRSYDEKKLAYSVIVWLFALF